MSIEYAVGDKVRRIVRFDGTSVSNAWDGAGRLASSAYPGETNEFGWYANGLLRTASNAVGVVSNAYDGANRLTFTIGAAPRSAVVTLGSDHSNTLVRDELNFTGGLGKGLRNVFWGVFLAASIDKGW